MFLSEQYLIGARPEQVPTYNPKSCSSMQEQAKTHAGQSPKSDDHQKFETGPHGTLAGVAGFDRSQRQCGQGGESIGPPSGLWQGKEQRYRRNEAADDKGESDLQMRLRT